MDKQATQFIPANPGWLALFEDEQAGETVVHAEPVIAWRLCPPDEAGTDPLARAVVGAKPWLEKADAEEAIHFFALVREEQLEPVFLEELRQASLKRREDVLEQARRSRESQQEGHAVWIRQRRKQRASAGALAS